MGPQSDRLFLTGLGILGDNPPLRNLQPVLPNGIHLRWAFTRDDGFPWYGFVLLYRNPSSPNRDYWLWRPVPNCPLPLALPITHPDYPARSAPIDQHAAEIRALNTIKYGTGTSFSGVAFEALHETLKSLVKGGPITPMAAPSRATKDLKGVPALSWKGMTEPLLPAIHPLDLLLLTSFHPAMAQMLGLYWVDERQEVCTGEAFDYLILALREPMPGPEPWRCALSSWEHGPARVDGYMIEGLSCRPASQLSAPSDVNVHLLPDNPPILGLTHKDAGSITGIHWQVPEKGKSLLPQHPVLYHLWRDYLGNRDKPTDSGTEHHLTDSGPILVSRPKIEAKWPSGWPEQTLYYIDQVYQEGWYRYRVSGMDLFGRISKPSEAGARASVIQILNKTAPPRPYDVVATLLDPNDLDIREDEAYKVWRKDHKGIVGLRIRWKWRADPMHQAPDAKEFRIYFNHGSAPPAKGESPDVWEMRCHVKPYSDTVIATASERQYEVFLPSDGTITVFEKGVPLVPSLNEPIVYANTAVTVADGAIHTRDTRTAGELSNRPGNESHTSSPAQVFRVKRDLPEPPVMPSDAEHVMATAADYHGRSYYSIDLPWRQFLSVHVYRALDASVFVADWAKRPRSPLNSTDFPDESRERRWNEPKRQQVERDLLYLNVLKDKMRQEMTEEEKMEKQGEPPLPFDVYSKLSDDCLRVLAGLPGTEVAFTQITTSPIPKDKNEERPQPENLHFRDTLDGRAKNRYFYRLAYVDNAYNISNLSLSSPPVCLPDVDPPRSPVLTSILGSERCITLNWASNREEDLAEYQVYRATTEQMARDLRQMSRVHREQDKRLSWPDKDVVGGTTYYYRVVAVDKSGNVSEPTPPAACKAIDTAPPEVAILQKPTWIRLDREGKEHSWINATSGMIPAVSLVWHMEDSQYASLVQRREEGSRELWQTVLPWAKVQQFHDSEVDSHLVYEYRILTRKANGQTSASKAQSTGGR